MAPHSPHVYCAVLSVASSGDNTVIAAPASGSIKIHGIAFTVDGATVITYKSGTTAVSGGYRLTGDGSSFDWPVADEPYVTIQPGQAFVLNSSNGVNIGGNVWYAY